MATRIRASILLAAMLLFVSAVAVAQTAPPPADPNAPPPPADPNAPPPGYPPPAGYPPPDNTGYPPPGNYPPAYQPPPGYAPSPGYAPPPAAMPPVHDGFFLRLHLGGGLLKIASEDEAGNEGAFVGAGGSFGAAIGASLMPNLILHGTFMLTGMSDPDFEVNGMFQYPLSGSFLVYGIGPGVTYYFQPVNVFISGTVAATVFAAEDPAGNEFDTETGFGVELMVGKEWWIAPQWGLGVAAELFATGGMNERNTPYDWGSTAFSLVVTSTYN